MEKLTSPSFPFYLTQLLSNFFKYSFSNFLLSYLNRILVVYFPSNSLLLNSSASEFNSISISLSFPFSFLFFTHFISSSLISLSKFFTKSIPFSKFYNFSQVSFSVIYFFYLTKYFGFPLTSCLFNIFSTLYFFFSLSICS